MTDTIGTENTVTVPIQAVNTDHNPSSTTAKRSQGVSEQFLNGTSAQYRQRSQT